MDTGPGTARPSGPSAQNQRAETVGLLSIVQDRQEVKSGAGSKPAVSFATTASQQQASPVGVYSAQLCLLHVQAAKMNPSPQCIWDCHIYSPCSRCLDLTLSSVPNVMLVSRLQPGTAA